MRVKLPMACPLCSAAIDVELEGWNYGAKLFTETVNCPACERSASISVPGRIVGVNRRGNRRGNGAQEG